MSIEGENTKGSQTGFAGISSMVSDVDAEIAAAQEAKPQQAKTSSGGARLGASGESSPQESTTQGRATDVYQQSTAAAQPPGGVSSGKQLLIAAAVIGAIWLVFSRPNTPSTATSLATAPPASAFRQGDNSSLNPSPGQLYEESPPAGTNNVLNSAQIRYCLSEGIRLTAAKTVVVNRYTDVDVDGYNAMVTDYNNRCGQYQYYEGSLEAVRLEVEANRSVLEAQGWARFTLSNNSNVTHDVAQSPPPIPNARAESVPAMTSSMPTKQPTRESSESSNSNFTESDAARLEPQSGQFYNFMQSVKSGTADDVEAMVKSGVDVNMRIRGTTPIIEAVRVSNVGAAMVLLDAGADPNQADGSNYTALDYARARGDTGLVNLLKTYGAVASKY